MDFDNTIVTACDHNYVWGAMLLGLSLRYYNTQAYYHIMGTNLTQPDIRCLESIPFTKVFSTDRVEMRSVCVQKPLAIESAETDIIIWMDSDCIITSNVDRYLNASGDRFQIRFRGEPENAQVYRDLYQSGDKPCSIPNRVLNIWKHDLNDLPESRINTVAQTNCFVLTRKHLPFITLWRNQMDKVIPYDTSGVYAKGNIGYSMTDESVLNSLFAFSSLAPEISEYLLDKDPTAYLAHFGLKPKPWQHFTTQSLRYYDEIQKILLWGKASGIILPPLPSSFLPAYRYTETIRALLLSSYRQIRYQLSSQARLLLRKWKKA
jgi:hypothetical protein